MRVTDLVTAAHNLSLNALSDLHSSWIAQSFVFGAICPDHTARFQANGSLDLLIRAMEDEWVKEPSSGIDFSLTYRVALSECWVLRAYEVVRVAAAELRRRGDDRFDQMEQLKLRFGLVRMPLAKGTIQHRKNWQPSEPLVLAHADGSDPREFVPDGPFLMPGAISSVTGSIVWWPVDVTTSQSVEISRRDLSNELLTAFD